MGRGDPSMTVCIVARISQMMLVNTIGFTDFAITFAISAVFSTACALL
jgi:hypothetical protein